MDERLMIEERKITSWDWISGRVEIIMEESPRKGLMEGDKIRKYHGLWKGITKNNVHINQLTIYRQSEEPFNFYRCLRNDENGNSHPSLRGEILRPSVLLN